MKYLITDTSIIRLSEMAGVIQNLSSGDKIEISNSRAFTDSIVIFPLNKCSFDTQLFIRALSAPSQVIEVNVVPFALDGGTGSSSGDSGGTQTVSDEDVADDEDVEGYLDDIFSGL